MPSPACSLANSARRPKRKFRDRTWKAHRREGGAALRERGYDPLPHVYAVAHSLTLSSRNRLVERLTRREVQVLGQLAERKFGNEQAAEALGIKRSSVQTLVHRVYQKLDVNGRMLRSGGQAPRGCNPRRSPHHWDAGSAPG